MTYIHYTGPVPSLVRCDAYLTGPVPSPGRCNAHFTGSVACVMYCVQAVFVVMKWTDVCVCTVVVRMTRLSPLQWSKPGHGSIQAVLNYFNLVPFNTSIHRFLVRMLVKASIHELFYTLCSLQDLLHIRSMYFCTGSKCMYFLFPV